MSCVLTILECVNTCTVTMDSSMQAVAAIKKETPLSVEEAIKLLRRDDVIYTAVPPSQPKAGEVYLFRPDKDINVGKFNYKVI